MFDQLTTEICDETLKSARRLFFDHGHDLAQAAARLGGACGEARVVSCGLQLEAEAQMTHRICKELQAVHRLLSLADVGDPERIETELFAAMDPASPEVEEICLLTDLIHGLLIEIERTLSCRGDRTAGADSNRCLRACSVPDLWESRLDAPPLPAVPR